MDRDVSKNVEFYFEVIGDGYFLNALEKFSIGEGFGLEFVCCVFADYYEAWEEDYFGKNGVAYYFDKPAVEHDQTIILTYDEFLKHLRSQCYKYLERNKDKREEVMMLLEKVGKKVDKMSK